MGSSADSTEEFAFCKTYMSGCNEYGGYTNCSSFVSNHGILSHYVGYENIDWDADDVCSYAGQRLVYCTPCTLKSGSYRTNCTTYVCIDNC